MTTKNVLQTSPEFWEGVLGQITLDEDPLFFPYGIYKFNELHILSVILFYLLGREKEWGGAERESQS